MRSRIMSFVALLLFETVVTSCYATADAVMALVPSDAKSVNSHHVGKSGQVGYSIGRRYPASGIDETALASLRKKGWAYCAKDGVARWATFIDSSSGDRERVYQRVSYLRRGDTLITIGERYYTNTDAQLQPGSQRGPDNTNQQVTLLETRVEAPQIDSLFSSSGVKCNDSP